MSDFIVYGYQNIIEPHRWYIGKTSRGLSERDRGHRKRKLIFDRYYSSHPERFVLVKLKSCQSKEEMNAWERIMIAQFNSIENGYNFTAGGTGGDTFSNQPEWKKVEIREKLSGENSPAKRPEVRAKMSMLRKGKKQPNRKHYGGANHHSSKEIILRSPLGLEYQFHGDCKKFCIKNGLDISSICKVLSGRYRHYRHWTARYAGEL